MSDRDMPDPTGPISEIIEERVLGVLLAPGMPERFIKDIRAIIANGRLCRNELAAALRRLRKTTEG